MKKIAYFGALLTMLAAGATSLGSIGAHVAYATNDTGAGDWNPVAGGTTVITPIENGTQIEGQHSWATRSAYKYKVKLDGLDFTFQTDECAKGDMYGFYFSSDGAKFYSEETTVVLNAFYMTGFAPTQTSYFLLRGHDYNKPVINYSQPDTTSKMGFHTATVRLVSNNMEDKVGFHCHFEKYNEEFYKMELTELWENQFWGDNLNYVKSDKYATITTYLLASDFPMDKDGNLYLMSWGIRSSVNSNSPKIKYMEISDEHSNAAEAFANKVLNELTCDPTGETAPDVEQWYALEDAFINLSVTSQKYINNASGTLIKQALEKYDYVITKYSEGYVDFLGRKDIIGSNNVNVTLVNDNIFIAVVGLGLVSIAIATTYGVYKKKKSLNK